MQNNRFNYGRQVETGLLPAILRREHFITLFLLFSRNLLLLKNNNYFAACDVLTRRPRPRVQIYNFLIPKIRLT